MLEVSRLTVVALLPIAFALGAVATYRPFAHGEVGAYVRLLTIYAGLGLVSYGVVRLRAPFNSRWPLVALVVTLAVGGSFHAVRLRHPIGRGAPIQQVSDDFQSVQIDKRRWDVALEPGATLDVGQGRARLSVPPQARASLELLLPTGSVWWLRPPARWWVPASFDERNVAEEVSWQARVERTGTFFVLVEVKNLLVQVAPYGLHVTARGPGGREAGSEILLPVLSDGKMHRWHLRRVEGTLKVALDGMQVWARPDNAPFGFLRFGETRSDALHGGVLEIGAVRYRRWWDRRSPAATA